jgi:NADH-quinone oxidoreductase subunit K
MATIGLTHFLAVAAILFALGIALVIVRRNAVLVLMGIELILNAAALNFVALARFAQVEGRPPAVTGDVVALFVIVIAAAEAAVAVGIVLSLFQSLATVDVDEADSLRG